MLLLYKHGLLILRLVRLPDRPRSTSCPPPQPANQSTRSRSATMATNIENCAKCRTKAWSCCRCEHTLAHDKFAEAKLADLDTANGVSAWCACCKHQYVCTSCHRKCGEGDHYQLFREWLGLGHCVHYRFGKSTMERFLEAFRNGTSTVEEAAAGLGLTLYKVEKEYDDSTEDGQGTRPTEPPKSDSDSAPPTPPPTPPSTTSTSSL